MSRTTQFFWILAFIPLSNVSKVLVVAESLSKLVVQSKMLTVYPKMVKWLILMTDAEDHKMKSSEKVVAHLFVCQH